MIQSGKLIYIVSVPQKVATLTAHDQLKTTVNLADLTPERLLRAGSYKLQVRYDNSLLAETAFTVDFRPDRDIPRLIALFENARPLTDVRLFAAGYLGQLTMLLGPLRLEYYPSPKDSPEVIRREASELRSWWSKNRESLAYRDGRLHKKGEAPKQ